jgi:hypothetical protein
MGDNYYSNVVEVVLTDEFVAWLREIDGDERNAVHRLIKLLELSGTTLGFPYSSAINGSKYALRELRKKGQPLRLIYAFDPKRQAVMLIGGDKTGDDRFYKTIVPRAEKLWEAHLVELAELPATKDKRRK